MIPEISPSALSLAAGKTVLFAHQSVGHNILDGVRALAADAGSQIRIVEARKLVANVPGIIHFQVGSNGDPIGKIEDFASTFAQGRFDGVDIAMVKLCYVDIRADSNVAALASRYVEVLDALKRNYPQTRFVAVTAPLTTVQTGPKAWIKRAIGRTPHGYAENWQRTAFNARLRQSLAPADLFDLAKWEAMGAAPLEFEGKPIESLNPALTTDGGHLNEQGRRLLATALLAFVATSKERSL